MQYATLSHAVGKWPICVRVRETSSALSVLMGIIFYRTSNLMWVIAESFLRAVTEKGVY